MTTAQIEARADALADRMARAGHPIAVRSFGDIQALKTGRFVSVGFDLRGYGSMVQLWTVKEA